MNQKTKLLYLLFISLILNIYSIQAQSKVYLIPSLHKLFKVNPKYTYDSLRSIINKISPDIIAVEIRSLDIKADSNYLKNNYPYEMWMMQYWFPTKIIMGFDWLGDELEGKALYDNWANDLQVKKLQKALSVDSMYSKKVQVCNNISKERFELLKTLSLPELLKSKDAELTKQYYACLAEQLKGSSYEKMLEFYNERNNRLIENIQKITKKNQKKIIVIVTGDDHYIIFKDILKHNNLNY